MAVMARLEGIPSRIAVGYAPGRPTGATVSIGGQGALPEYEVDARDAHAWPELYFQGLGWVAVRADPVPRRGSGLCHGGPGRPAAPARTKTTTASLPSDSATPAPLPSCGAAAAPGRGRHGGRRPAALAARAVRRRRACCSSACCWRPRGWRAPRVRRRRLNGAAGRRRGGAAGLGRTAGPRHGLRRGARTSETPRHFSDTAARSRAPSGNRDGVDAAGHRAVGSLTADFERQQYGRPPGARRRRQCRRPRACRARDAGRLRPRAGSQRSGPRCGAHAGPLVRFRAAWLPPSVMAAWRRAAAAPVPRRPPRSTAHPARPRGCLVKDPRGGCAGCVGSWLRRS